MAAKRLTLRLTGGSAASRTRNQRSIASATVVTSSEPAAGRKGTGTSSLGHCISSYGRIYTEMQVPREV